MLERCWGERIPRFPKLWVQIDIWGFGMHICGGDKLSKSHAAVAYVYNSSSFAAQP
jgi:hypothetical protein